MVGESCLDCGTKMTGADCAVCSSAGKKEAIAIVVILASVAAVMGIYVSLALL